MNFNDFKKLLNEEDTQNLKQMTSKKGWLSGYFGDRLDFTLKNKLDIWVCEKKISFINDNLIKLFKYLSDGCDVSILIKILSGENVEKRLSIV